jgi:hypothetical protein
LIEKSLPPFPAKGESKMFRQMINIVFRLLAVLFSAVVLGVVGFIAGSMIFAILGLEFNGREGYEAGGPIGFILGALTGLIASSVLLFRKRAAK